MHPIKAAVLLNNRISACPYSDLVKHNFTHSITTTAPGSQVDFYDPVEARTYPAPEAYDLIVLSGGTASLINGDAQEPWVPRMIEFIREVVKYNANANADSNVRVETQDGNAGAEVKSGKNGVKLVGICWGHQAIAKALGGEIGLRKGTLLGVYNVKLSLQGQEFFRGAVGSASGSDSGPESINIHKFHKRIVTKPPVLPPNDIPFIPLASDPMTDMFLSPCNNILSFQGHPELDKTLAKALLDNSPDYRDSLPSSSSSLSTTLNKTRGGEGNENTQNSGHEEQESELDVVLKSMQCEHDGLNIWWRIIAWVRE